MRLGLTALAVVALAACGHVVPGSLTGDGKDFDFAQRHECAEPQAGTDLVEVRYLGSGGVFVAWRGEAVLLGPSFSNPGLLRAAGWRARYNRERIEEGLRFLSSTAAEVKGIVAGHSHYDHVGDLPEIANRPGLAGARIYVNRSGHNMLHAAPGLLPRVTEIREGERIEISDAIHIVPVRSSHAPQLCRWRGFPLCTYASGEVKKPWKEPWEGHFLRSFRGGEIFAFVIELREEGRTRFRIYYNDSSSDSPDGQVAGEFDLAILCIAQWNWVRDYPRDLVAVLRPRHVVVSHWEDFFGKRKEGAKFIRTMSNGSAARFLRAIDEKVAGGGAGPVNEVCGAVSERWTMPVVGAPLQFEPR